MTTGTEMMMNALFKTIGLDPQEFVKSMQQTIATIQDLHTQISSINQRLGRLENHLGVEVPTAEILPPIKRIAGP